MKQIREWLENGQPYAQGLALYETHGKSQVVLRSLRFGESEFTRARLRRELEKLAGEKPVRAIDTSAECVRETAKRVQVSPEKMGSSPEHPERRTWYATRAYAHAQLELVATDRERRDLASDILALTDQVDASFRPAPAAAEASLPPLPADAGEQRRQLTNLRSLASKLKKNPDRAGELARVKSTITQLEVKLKRDGEPQLHPRH